MNAGFGAGGTLVSDLLFNDNDIVVSIIIQLKFHV